MIIRRSVTKYPNAAGRWDIVGGRIDPGISLNENLKREIYEETQIKLTDQEPQLLLAQDILRVPGKHIVRLTYSVKIEGVPEVILDTNENDMFQWLSMEEVKKIDDLDTFLSEVLDKKF